MANNNEKAKEQNEPNQRKLLYTGNELMDLSGEDIPWLWEGIIPQKGIGFLTGPSDSNKTTIARQLGLAITQRHELFLGRKLTSRSGRVLVVCTEDDEQATKKDLKKQANGMGEGIDLSDITFYFKSAIDAQELKKVIGQSKCDLVVLDIWTDTFKGNINDTIDVRNNLAALAELAHSKECFVLGIHHTRKGSEEKTPHKDQMVGSQGLQAKSRVVLYLRKEGVGLIRRLSIEKGNYCSDELKSQPMMLKLIPETMLLELSDAQPAGYGFEKVREYTNDKELFMDVILRLTKAGYSQDKIVLALRDEFPSKKTPSKGTIQAWLKQSGDSPGQSVNP